MSPSLSAGLEAVAIAVPECILDNDHWRRHHPSLVAQAEQRIWMWKRPLHRPTAPGAFDLEMEPYLDDPFRGARQRRVLGPEQSALTLEAAAARDALAAAELSIDDVDGLICTSFLPDSHGIGGAAFLARELGLRGAAWNLESACSSTVVALQTAASLVAGGQFRRMLVVTSCTYSRATREDDPIAWGIGDAATAMLVAATPGAGVLATHVAHTADTCEAVAYHLEAEAGGALGLRMRTSRHAARLLRETSERYLGTCVNGALDAAGIALDEVDHFVFNTPLAWYARFCARSLGIDPAKTLSVYPLYANVGPCLPGLNLLHAAHWNGIHRGQTVVLYSVGSVSSCAATVLRWGDVALGALPEGVSPELLHMLEHGAPLSAVA
ncbi:MAG: 3-oxoacyl-[acyl-carrier-protein] synthase III C-terminal domain-containing protein [Acidobacteriota bacterium]